MFFLGLAVCLVHRYMSTLLGKKDDNEETAELQSPKAGHFGPAISRHCLERWRKRAPDNCDLIETFEQTKCKGTFCSDAKAIKYSWNGHHFKTDSNGENVLTYYYKS